MIRVHISICTLLAILLACSTTLAAPPEGKPVLVPMWKKTTIGLPKEDDINFDQNKEALIWLQNTYDRAKVESRRAGRPQIAPSTPRALDDLVIYVNDSSIAALLLTERAKANPPYKPGEIFWAIEHDYFNHYRSNAWRDRFETWLNYEKVFALDCILNTTRRSAFSTVGKEVQFSEDIAIFPPHDQLKTFVSDAGFPIERGAQFRWNSYWDNLSENRVRIADSDSGKLTMSLWPDLERPFGWSHYLGVPLAFADNWFVIHEKGKSIRLTNLSFEHLKKQVGSIQDTSVIKLKAAIPKAVLWDTELASPSTSVFLDPHRRIHAINLVENKGSIICPTHLGRVVAVDSKTGKIQWTHEYAPLDAKRFPTFAPEWVVVPPVVVGDKYIYAPADFPELLCLNVADGKKVWSIKKGEGLYPAVNGEQVLVIGEKTLRSLRLMDGIEQWKLDLPGLPCGRGAMLGAKYLLPFSEPKTWKGMIAIVDLKAGKILEVLKPEKDEPIGNLVVHQEFLISQTLTEIAVFPIRK